MTVKLMMDHWIDIERFRHTCYCGRELRGERWDSFWMGERHYKRHSCTCGKEIIMLVNFFGSGHDSWDGTHSWLEKTLKPVERKEKIKHLDDHSQ